MREQRLTVLRWLGSGLAAAALWLATAAHGVHPVELTQSAGMQPLAGALLLLEDAGRKLTIADVASPAFAARFEKSGHADRDVNAGYTDAALWFALKTRLAADAPSRWLLEIGYPSLDRIEVYTPRPGGDYERMVAGDLQPHAYRPYPHRNFVFPLQLAPGAEQTVYFRVTSAGNLTVPATLWQPEALHRQDQKTYSMLSLYYGMLLALGLYNLLLYFAVRDPVFLAYVAFVASMAVGQASMNGFGNQFIWPVWPAWGNVALPSGMSATGFFGAVFTRLFLGTKQQFPQLDRALVAIGGAFAIAAFSPLALPYQFAAIVTSLVGFVFSVAAVSGGVYCMAKGHPGARWFLLAWTALLAGAAVLALRNFGWIPTTAFTLHSMQIGSALEMLLLSFALAERINSIRCDKELAQQAMMNVLLRSERELEERVSERTRELETARQQLEHLAQHDPLTGLANRILLDDRVARAVARAQRAKTILAVMVVDLDDFKSVNDTWGHAVGDQVLVAIAQRLKACVRETDTVARIGGDEFVVVLEDLHASEEAGVIAGKLVAAVNSPFDPGTGPLQVSVSIGVACLPDGCGGEQLIKRADAAMYAAKAAGRNRWSMAGP